VRFLVQPQSIPRRIYRTAVALALLAGGVGTLAARDDTPPAGLRPAPEFLDLFAPRLHRDAYRAFVSALPVEELLRRLTDDPQLQHPPGSWTTVQAAPADAFGDAGSFHRFRLVRLYGSTPARVARGPRVADDGRTLGAWTLVSPYPDPSLMRLERGTLILVVRAPER
jgi:hypothetical protein